MLQVDNKVWILKLFIAFGDCCQVPLENFFFRCQAL